MQWKHIPAVSIWLSEWNMYIKVADSGRKSLVSKYVMSAANVPFAQIERSAPIVLGDKVFFVRILVNKKTKEKMIDVRQYELEQTDRENNFEPTVYGVSLPIKEWELLWKTANKLIKKWNQK